MSKPIGCLRNLYGTWWYYDDDTLADRDRSNQLVLIGGVGKCHFRMGFGI
jgi:hypothetical protein